MKLTQLRQIIKEEISKVLKEESYFRDNEFENSPNMASYNDVLGIFKDYEDEEILSDFMRKFPKGKPISKKAYMDFAKSHMSGYADAPYEELNWISLTDPNIFKKYL
jgi:hypothetical protein